MMALLNIASARKNALLRVQCVVNLQKIIVVVVGLVFLHFIKKDLNESFGYVG